MFIAQFLMEDIFVVKSGGRSRSNLTISNMCLFMTVVYGFQPFTVITDSSLFLS